MSEHKEPTRRPFPLYGDAFKQNPYPTYARLMNEAQVHAVEFPSGVCGWLVTGYEAAVRTLTDSRLGKRHVLGNARWRARASIMPEPQHSELQVHLLHQDLPRHTVLRGLLTEAFASSRIQPMRASIEIMIHRLIDEICGAGQADLISDFAARLPLLVLSEVIGLAAGHRQQFRPAWCKVVQPVGPSDPGRHAYIGRLRELQAYIDHVIAETRGGNTERLLVRLIAAHDSGALDYAELASTIFQLLVAGQEPVSNQIGIALLALLQRPEQIAKLRAHPELAGAAVEELLRIDGAFENTTWRFFAESTEWYGAHIPAGDAVIVALAAANHDPARFACPHMFNFERTPNLHLSFGYGRHFCPAASLARLELELSLRLLLERLPDLRLACPVEHLRWIPAVLTRGVKALPVTFTPPSGANK